MNWLQRLIRRRQLESELDKEIRGSLERQISDYRRAGLTEQEARREAHLAFGGIEKVREECREARGTHWLESTAQDLRLALHTLRKSPGFTFMAITTLALGIGENTAIFALLDSTRLRSLPVPDPGSLALLQIEGANHFGITEFPRSLSYPVFRRISDYQRGFSGVFAWTEVSRTVGPTDEQRPAERAIA